MAKRVFVYSAPKGEIVITEQTARQLGAVGWELVRQFHTIQDARTWVAKEFRGSIVKDMVRRQYTGITPEGRERMRQKKLGANNPNAKGLDEDHKQKIQATMAGTRRGDKNPMWGLKHRPTSRLKTSLTMKMTLPRRRWCVDDKGVEHFVNVDFVLPEGWAWGRNTLKKWERRPRKVKRQDD